MTTLILLAGGESKRVHEPNKPKIDKALLKVGNKRFLERIIENVGREVEEIIVTVNTEERKRLYEKVLWHLSSKFEIKILKDAKSQIKGPLNGIRTGLEYSEGSLCLTLPVDVPFIKPEVVREILKEAVKWETTTLIWPNGGIEPLIATYKREYAVKASKTLLSFKRSRPDDFVRAASDTFFLNVNALRKFDPELESFRNINSLKDLIKKDGRKWQEGELKNSVLIKAEEKIFHGSHLFNKEELILLNNTFFPGERKRNFFWVGLISNFFGEKTKKREVAEEFLKEAYEAFTKERMLYINKKVYFLAFHSGIDASKCYMKIFRGEKNKELEREISFFASKFKNI